MEEEAAVAHETGEPRHRLLYVGSQRGAPSGETREVGKKTVKRKRCG